MLKFQVLHLRKFIDINDASSDHTLISSKYCLCKIVLIILLHW